MRLVTNLEITTRGSGTNNSGLTTLLLHDNLKTNSEVRTVKTARGNGLTISTYSVNTTNSEYTKTCSNWNPAGEGSCITPLSCLVFSFGQLLPEMPQLLQEMLQLLPEMLQLLHDMTQLMQEMTQLMQEMTQLMQEMPTENREPRTENREPRTENREPRTENSRERLKLLTPILLSLTFFAGECSTPTPLPEIPKDLTAKVVSYSQIDLSWNAVANATKYNLFDGTTQIGGDITETKYSHTGLEEVSTHTYTVKACNAGGCSEASAAVSATTLLKVTAIEHPKGSTDVRDRYGVFKISAIENLTDYRLAVVPANTTPTATQMESGTHTKRNLGTTEKYILFPRPLSATGATANDLLSPSTKYWLFGMEAGGKPIKLAEFTTDAVITSVVTGTTNRYMDESIAGIIISAKAGETIIMPTQWQLDKAKVYGKDAIDVVINYFLDKNDFPFEIIANDGGIQTQPAAYSNFKLIPTIKFSTDALLAARTCYINLGTQQSASTLVWEYDTSPLGVRPPPKVQLWKIVVE
ncbi:hypothetical protein CHS0354_000742 [Potamilus streckersoni]|uniref:Fibronectin type-III domain-containing protein n=1 Tax=Potamilus streckersoni TaxID=2493646 RepID=A0AAE0T7B7_9BIVA|nr:hypothetical protein CHS0354_000742 [Potamilus streckersoni]